MQQFFSLYNEVNKKNGLAWKKYMAEKRQLKPKTVNIRLNGFNSYCEMIGKETEKVKTMKVHQSTAINNVISEDDYNKLLNCLLKSKNIRWYYNVKLLAKTGARVSEAIRLKKSDFDRGYAEMWTKGKIRRIYIPKSFRDEAKDYYSALSDDDFLIKNRYGESMTTRGVAQNLVSFGKLYGIDKRVMHPHSFRHLFALEFLKHNTNLSLLADVMGHSSVATTAIYTRMTKEQQANAVDDIVNW